MEKNDAKGLGSREAACGAGAFDPGRGGSGGLGGSPVRGGRGKASLNAVSENSGYDDNGNDGIGSGGKEFSAVDRVGAFVSSLKIFDVVGIADRIANFSLRVHHISHSEDTSLESLT